MSDPLQSDRCSRYLKAVAGPERLRIVQCLRDGPRTVGEIADALGARLGNVSHHLKLLRAARIVVGAKAGEFVSYSLNPLLARGGSNRSLDVLDFGCCRIELGSQRARASI